MLFGFIGGARPEWLVAFLGNPGPKYERTRHNAGFMSADFLAAEKSVSVKTLKFKSLSGRCTLSGAPVIILKPQTYMNLSGEAVKEAASFYKIEPSHVIIVCDDTALPLGKIRIKRQGSAGGHNGLKNIIAHLGTEEFPRVKIGVGAPPHEQYELIDWVIGKMSEGDYKELQKASKEAVGAVEAIIGLGIDAAMNKYN